MGELRGRPDGSEPEQRIERPDIDWRPNVERMREAYDRLGWSAVVADLNRRDPRQDPRYLAEGSGGCVFRVTRDNEDYIVRTPTPYAREWAHEPDSPYDPQQGFENRTEALARAKGLKKFEQGVACSPEDLAVVTKVVPGKSVQDMSAAEIEEITRPHITEASKAIQTSVKRGIAIDTDSSNNLYSPKNGFAFIDYEPANRRGGEEANSAAKLFCHFVDGLTAQEPKNLTSDRIRALMPVVEQGLGTLRRHYPDSPAEYRQLGSVYRELWSKYEQQWRR